jgi:hypothetical protein
LSGQQSKAPGFAGGYLLWSHFALRSERNLAAIEANLTKSFVALWSDVLKSDILPRDNQGENARQSG